MPRPPPTSTSSRSARGSSRCSGPRFLTLLYQRILSSDGSFLLIADAHDQVAGFVAGSGDVRGLYRAFLLHDGVRASITAAGRLVSGWRRALETLRHGSGDGAGRGRGTELLAIAVDSGHQGTGIGGRLVGAFLDEVVRRGGDSAYVVVAPQPRCGPTVRAGRVQSEPGVRAARRGQLAAAAVGRAGGCVGRRWDAVSLPVVAVVSFGVALVVTPVMIVVARRSGVVDRPGALKDQATPVPYLGGVAVFAGAAVGALSGRPSVLIPLAAALVLGVADDRFDLSPGIRLVGEVGVGLAVVVTGPVRFDGAVAALLLVAVTVLLINGVNLMDGLDMLAGGVCAVAALSFALLLDGPGRQLAVALGAALVAFLLFNRPPARVYLGDGGAYLLGAGLSVLVSEAWAPHVTVEVGVGALALVALPAAELAFAVVRRLRGRTSLVAGDRGHPYDRLVRRGWHRTAASLAYIGVEAVLGLGAVAIVRHLGLGAVIAFDAAAAAVLVALAAATGALSPDQGAAA